MLNNVKFEVLSAPYSKEYIAPVVKDKYFYSYFDNDSKNASYFIDNEKSKLYLGNVEYIKVEIGICENEQFTVSFINPNGIQINSSNIIEMKSLGKTTYTFKQQKNISKWLSPYLNQRPFQK